MGLVNVALAMMCFEALCPGDETYDPSALRKERFRLLAEELKNELFTVTTTESEQLSGTETMSNGTTIGNGFAFQFLNILRDKYKFKYNVRRPKQRSLEQNGDGILSQLVKKEADIAVAFLPVMPAFRQYVDFSRALDEGDWVILMRRPEESATGSGLWAPFTFQVWILILVSLICVGPVVYALIVLESRLRKEEECPVYSLPACVWFVYGALLKQGSTISPITDTARLLFATWWIFITILTAFYTANLTAFLTLSKFTLPVAKTEDVGSKRYYYTTPKGGAIEEQIKQVADFRMKLNGAKGDYVDNKSEKQILTEMVYDKNFLYMQEKPIVEYLMYYDYLESANANIKESDRCRYVITKWKLLKTPRAFAFRKGFRYYELFNEIIQHLVESGIIKFKLREKLPNTEICPENLGSKERQLYNTDLFMTYVIVGAGFGIATAIFISELVYNRYNDREMQSRTPKLQNLFAEDVGGVGMVGGPNVVLKRRNKHGEFKFATFGDNDNVKGKLWHEIGGQPPPPPYHALFNPPFANSPNGVKKTINGRDYWIVKSVYGDTKLIPVRTPSALLFQHTQK